LANKKIMSYLFTLYFDVSETLLSSFTNEEQEPFIKHLKKHFAQHKKYGGRDRKLISEICFSYWRLSFYFDVKIERKNLLMAVFIFSENEKLSKYVEEKISETESADAKILQQKIAENQIDTFDGNFKKFKNIIGTETENWTKLFAKKASVYLFVFRNITKIKEFLGEAVLSETKTNTKTAFEIKADTPIETILQGHDADYRIQDLSSQLSILNLQKYNLKNKMVWDCCSGAGGKSLMLKDAFTEIELFASDNRASIIQNLKSRFSKEQKSIAGTAVLDLLRPQPVLEFTNKLGAHKVLPDFFDVIIADVPCSGSGTWHRSPEIPHFMGEIEIEAYSLLQKNIIATAMPYLKSKGKFVYITCSVFKPENEDNVQHFIAKYGLVLLEQNYITDSDMLFTAVFEKP